MACLCKKLIGDKLQAISPCFGNLWIFENLIAEEKQALAKASLKKAYKPERDFKRVDLER